ncbi:MFS transporter [Phyllobacterium salinisoli]|uniref:MFS transporter n=1 Tax=Phyllobacterium salinisoli TaxID=1899321 RepID=A0A368K2N5_9HYPH|nr:MFS transporter [Phyllobacterium salinisoli]RCS23648.1 MFS transporter [Phyllobacterium salinisoli]
MEMRVDTPRAVAGRSGYLPRERLAIWLLFLMNGFMVGSWAPKIPEFAERLNLSKGELGLMILVFGIGSLVMMPVAGMQIARLGGARVSKITAVLLLPSILALTFTQNIPAAAIALFLFGGFVGGMDVAMNANAVAVEQKMRRAIMSSCHAFWSLGGLIGAGVGGYLIGHFGTVVHAVVATVIVVVMLAVAWPIVHVDRPAKSSVDGSSRARLPLQPLPWLVGLMALFSMVPEGAVLDWSALYLMQDLGAPVSIAGLGFAAFSLTMAIMRFAGDLVRERLGAVLTLRLCTVTAIVGMLAASFAPDPIMVIIGFALCGIGISNMVPIAFSIAGNLPGMAPGVGLSIATTLGYSGILFAPSSIGFIAEYTGFSAVFAALPLLLLVVLALSGLARYADGHGEEPGVPHDL